MNTQELKSSAETDQKSEDGLPVSGSHPVFDANFFLSVLPERVVAQCQGDPANVPVVILHLADGSRLDLCHIAHLSDRWFAVQFFRDSETCAEMDAAFLPYEMVMRITVSVRHSGERPIGFTHKEVEASPGQPLGQPA